MLVLVYLVCMLSQTKSVSSSDNSGVYPIENSQKLMLTIPTDIPSNTLSDSDNCYSTTEALETITDNSITKYDNLYIGTHPLYPMQEPMTTPMPILEKEIFPEVTIVTTPVQESITREESAAFTTTEENPTPDIIQTNYPQGTTNAETIRSVSISSIPELHNSVSPMPIKRSLSLDVLKMFKNTSIETTTESQLNMSTPIMNLLEEPTEINQLSTDLLTSSSDPDEQIPTTSTVSAFSIPPPISEDDLFIDNWANHISVDNKDIYQDLKDDSSTYLNFMEEPTKSLFQNEDSKLAHIESTILKDESNRSSLLQEPVIRDIEHKSHLQYSDTEETHPIFSPQNLLNLFAFDHQPSSSNHKTTWWPKSKSSSMSILAENSVKSQNKRANRISINDDSQEISTNQRMFSQGFDNMLNRKLKNSVSILERLFGNYFLQ